MKKQSDFHGPNRGRENESAIVNPSSASYTPSKPKGIEDHAHPGHISRGAAESKANPVHEEDPVSESDDRRQR